MIVVRTALTALTVFDSAGAAGFSRLHEDRPMQAKRATQRSLVRKELVIAHTLRIQELPAADVHGSRAGLR